MQPLGNTSYVVGKEVYPLPPHHPTTPTTQLNKEWQSIFVLKVQMALILII